MGRCVHCGETESLSFTCRYCGRTVCSTHRLPENHECTHQSVADTLGPELRSRAVRTESRTRDRGRRDRNGVTIVRSGTAADGEDDRRITDGGRDRRLFRGPRSLIARVFALLPF